MTSDESDAESGEPQTAVVLFTDGQHNLGPSPLQTARILGSQGVAFYCVSMGASQSAPDLAVISLEHPPMVFQKDRVRGVMVVRDRMPAGQPFVAQIRYETEVLWQKQLLTRNEMERRIEFEFSVDELVERIGAQFEFGCGSEYTSVAFRGIGDVVGGRKRNRQQPADNAIGRDEAAKSRADY